MKTLILMIAAFVIITALWGDINLTFNTKDIAQTRMILHRLGGRFAVCAEIAPAWTAARQVGDYQRCARIYSVNVCVGR